MLSRSATGFPDSEGEVQHRAQGTVPQEIEGTKPKARSGKIRQSVTFLQGGVRSRAVPPADCGFRAL